MSSSKIVEFELKSPIKKVSRLHRLSSNNLAKHMSEIGLVRGTLPFLMEVICHDGSTQQDLTDGLSIDRAATARSLQHLAEEGFIYRVEDKDNRRQKLVYASDKTKKMQRQLLSILEEHKSKMFDGFSEKEKDDFLLMMDRMIENMRSI